MLCGGGIDRPPSTSVGHILATLCRFDHNLALRSKPGPFIPMERRHGNMEIWRIQGRDFGRVFETGSMTGLMS